MGSVGPWITAHWTTWLVPLLTWIFGNFTGAAFRWFYPSRKEWKEERKAREDGRSDEKVIRALFVGGMATGIFDSWQISQRTHLDHETVCDSLERLRARGIVTRAGGGTLDHPAPGWMYLDR